MQQKFMYLIVFVFVATVFFGFLIWWQLGRIAKKALEAKQKKEAYMTEIMKQQNEKIEKLNWVGGDEEEKETKDREEV